MKKEKEKSPREFSKEAEPSLAMNDHKILNFVQKRTLLGGTKLAKTRKGCHEAMTAVSQEGGFSPLTTR